MTTNNAINSAAAGSVSSVATSGMATGGTITTTGTITVTAAVKADQTTGTSTTVAVVPNVQQNHASACKAWAHFTSMSSSPPTISSNYNVTSISRTSAGVYVVNFTTAFSSSEFCGIAQGQSSVGFAQTNIASASSANLITDNTGATAADFNGVAVAYFGTQ